MSIPAPVKSNTILERLEHFFRCRIHTSRPLSQQIAQLRWLAPLSALLLVVIHQTAEWLWFADAHLLDWVTEIGVYALAGPFIIWLALGWIQQQVAQKEATEQQLVKAHDELMHLNRRISFLFHVSQQLVEAVDEEDLAARLLQCPPQVSPHILACSLVRFDDQQQPMPVETQGTLDESLLAEWYAHLSSQGVRRRCQVCQLRAAKLGDPCPLFYRLPIQDVGRIVCIPLERGGRTFAILGLFLKTGQTLSEPEQDLLETMAAASAIAMENMRLRTRELSTLYEINETLQLRLDLEGVLARLLTQTMEASGAEAGMILLQNAEGEFAPSATAGAWRAIGSSSFVAGLMAGARQFPSHEPVVMDLRTPATTAEIASILWAPIPGETGPLGAIVLGSHQHDAFPRQHVRLVSAIANQTALLVQNAQLYARLELQAILAERGRLAREMHDGLAQTLGYMKLRANQIARWVESGQSERAAPALRELAATANDAYLDLRAVLDGLRLPLEGEPQADFTTLLKRCVTDFEKVSGLTANLVCKTRPVLPATTQVHLLRIVQEALTNIRKHAHAHRVDVELSEHDHRLRLVIADDGQGFEVGREQPATHHGLQLMRERAALLGAELAVMSTPGAGTRVMVELFESTPNHNGGSMHAG